MRKSIKDLVKGDKVHYYGGVFECTENARMIVESAEFYREPKTYYQCSSVCITGEVRGYFKPSTIWGFQGVEHVTYSVE